MGRVLTPLMGVLGLLALVAGIVWAERDMSTVRGVLLVAAGAGLLLAAAALAAAVEVTTRRRHPLP